MSGTVRERCQGELAALLLLYTTVLALEFADSSSWGAVCWCLSADDPSGLPSLLLCPSEPISPQGECTLLKIKPLRG